MRLLGSKILFFLAVNFAMYALFLTFGKFWYEVPAYFSVRAKHDFLGTAAPEVDTYVIGDSRALVAFDPALMKDRAWNLAIDGGTPIDGYYMLKKLISSNNKRKIRKIYISYAPVHFDRVEFYESLLRVDLLSDSDIFEIFRVAYALNEKFWLKTGSNFDGIFDRYVPLARAFLIKYRFPLFYKPAITAAFFEEGRRRTNMLTYENILFHAGHDSKPEGNAKEINQDVREYKTFEWKKVHVHYFKKMLSLARNNNIEVIYVTLPFNKTSEENVPLEYFLTYESFWGSIAAEFPGIVFHYEIRSYDNIFFADMSHFNEEGTALFLNSFYAGN